MTLSIFVSESIRVVDVLVGAVKRLLTVLKKTISRLFTPKISFLVKKNGNKAPPVVVMKGENQKA